MTRSPLQERVAGDLAGCRLHPSGPQLALVEVAGVPSCWWQVRHDRRRLLHVQVSTFHLDGPPSTADVRVEFRHSGHVRRTGLTARVRGRDEQAGRQVRDRLLEDGELKAASLPLDFTSFTVAPHEGRWRASLALMGGSYVRTVFPPSGSYVRLAADQTAALLATVRVLHRRLPVAPETLVVPTPPATPPTDDSQHLPRRPV